MTPSDKLAALLASAYSPEEFTRVLAMLDLVVASVDGRITTLFEAGVALVDRHGLLTELFDHLARDRPRRTPEIARVRRLFFRAPPPPGAENSFFSLILNRFVQWNDLKRYLSDGARSYVFMLHGDFHQDINRFIDRVKRFVDDPEGRPDHRQHTVVLVPSNEGNDVPESAEEWETRIRNEVEKVNKRGHNTTADALQELTRHKGALVIFTGPGDGGLCGEPRGPLNRDSLAALDRFIRLRLPELRRRHASTSGFHLHWLIPIEHPPYEGARPEDLVHERLVRSLKVAVPSDEMKFLVELTIPDFAEVRSSIELHMQRTNTNSDIVIDMAKKLYDQHARRPQGFAALAEDLSRLLGELPPKPEEP